MSLKTVNIEIRSKYVSVLYIGVLLIRWFMPRYNPINPQRSRRVLCVVLTPVISLLITGLNKLILVINRSLRMKRISKQSVKSHVASNYIFNIQLWISCFDFGYAFRSCKVYWTTITLNPSIFNRSCKMQLSLGVGVGKACARWKWTYVVIHNTLDVVWLVTGITFAWLYHGWKSKYMNPSVNEIIRLLVYFILKVMLCVTLHCPNESTFQICRVGCYPLIKLPTVTSCAHVYSFHFWYGICNIFRQSMIYPIFHIPSVLDQVTEW